MIYISSASVKKKSIIAALQILIENGFKNIELSGGTEYEDKLIEGIVFLQAKHSLNLLVHNYFPPPKKHFVLNLASLNDAIYEETLNFYQNSIDFSRSIGSSRFSLHAGFFVDAEVMNLGKVIDNSQVHDREKAIQRFCRGYDLLKTRNPDMAIYVENNVLSEANFLRHKKKAFMLLDKTDYRELSSKISFELLLDVGHLKVSAQTLKLNFSEEFDYFFQHSEYFHLSDNDGLSDTNQSLSAEGSLMAMLQKKAWNGKTVSLEIYEDIEDIKVCYKRLCSIMGKKCVLI